MPGVSEQTRSVTRTIEAPVQDVWAVLADGWLYPGWVVGASRMREVGDDWPRAGSQLQHSVGNWPFLINDKTEVLESRPMELLRLKAHAWPAGSAEVLIELEPDGERTSVEILEDALSGPVVMVPQPVRQLLMVPRNREGLRRLAFLAEGRHRLSS